MHMLFSFFHKSQYDIRHILQGFIAKHWHDDITISEKFSVSDMMAEGGNGCWGSDIADEFGD